jgi:hypothetical protein
MRLYRAIGLISLAAACARSDAQPSAAQAVAVVSDAARPWRKPEDKIDSILPMPEYLRRFRVGVAEPARFAGGAADREALARKFLSGVAKRDTAALRNLLLSQAEFAWLLFPDHVYSRPPYELDPALFWMQLRSESDKGLETVLRREGGRSLALVAVHCARDTVQVRARSVRIWSPCTVRYRSGNGVVSHRLFGSIVERDGRMKLLSLANDF